MKYLLDTNTVSFILRGDPAVASALSSHARTDILLPQPVVAEIEYGLSRLPGSARKTRLRGRFEVLLSELPRADWTDTVSRAFGDIKADLEQRGVRIEDFDCAVAAHALALEATLVTDDFHHLKRFRGLSVQNWRSGLV